MNVWTRLMELEKELKKISDELGGLDVYVKANSNLSESKITSDEIGIDHYTHTKRNLGESWYRYFYGENAPEEYEVCINRPIAERITEELIKNER